LRIRRILFPSFFMTAVYSNGRTRGGVRCRRATSQALVTSDRRALNHSTRIRLTRGGRRPPNIRPVEISTIASNSPYCT
jgi:hypothetical protein